VLPRRERDSALDKSGAWDNGEDVGMEKPTRDETGSEGLKAEAESASYDSDDLPVFKLDTGIDTSVGVGAVMDAADERSSSVLDTTTSRCVVPSRG
jgi:hypothetical protein